MVSKERIEDLEARVAALRSVLDTYKLALVHACEGDETRILAALEEARRILEEDQPSTRE
jgi:hypothetical protein